MAKAKPNKVVKGYVVKRETIEEIDDPKRPGNKIKKKRRVEISRLFHAIGAAETFLAMCRKEWPDGDFFIHEKTGVDGLTHQAT
jgi:hypothetical protein